jgi:hypothetical protein
VSNDTNSAGINMDNADFDSIPNGFLRIRHDYIELRILGRYGIINVTSSYSFLSMLRTINLVSMLININTADNITRQIGYDFIG